ncbi:hypothetical protein L6164_019434 [Bauhinia variegata]|uniref:Uncharacterized protein n=1 Tax=Bauhinia variegata TaxID=167791 RepID=A0ACB9MS37_BAUVA|nr:hypothetical protein L6164_019434 [Bauhinia variegata]
MAQTSTTSYKYNPPPFVNKRNSPTFSISNLPSSCHQVALILRAPPSAPPPPPAPLNWIKYLYIYYIYSTVRYVEGFC